MKPIFIFLIIFFLSICIFLSHFFIVGKAIYGDGRYYYSYLPSLLIEHSINLSSAFTHADIPNWILTPRHLPANIYPIGPAIFWAIPYSISYGIAFLLGQNSPFALWLQIPMGIFVIGLGSLGLFILFKTLKLYFSLQTSLLTIFTLFLTTNLLFYGAVDVLNSHIITFFLASCFVYIWLQNISNKTILLQGILLGLLVLVRPQDLVFALLPLSSLVMQKQPKILLSFFVTGLVFTPQLFLWQVLWGSWIINPYLHAATFNFWSPHIFGVLFNPSSGFFLWTPVTMLATIGLFLFAKKYPQKGVPMIAVYATEIFVIASWSIWWEGASYSARMLISSLPFLGFGTAYLFEHPVVKQFRYFIIGTFGILNCLLVLYFLLQK